MRSLQRRRQYIWTCEATRSDSEIEGAIWYGRPEKHWVTVSNTSGTPHELPVGIVPEYSRYFISYDRDFNPKEGMLCFVDVTPQLDINGNLAVDVNGTPYTTPDYVLTHIMNTGKGTIARYGLKKIAGESETNTL